MKSKQNNWSLDEYHEFIKTGKEPNHSPPVPLTYVEQATGDQPVQEGCDTPFDTPVHIHIRSLRYRLADADGISAKAAIDGLVHRGLLKDDNPRWVQEVSYSQEKVPKTEEEKTIITIQEIE